MNRYGQSLALSMAFSLDSSLKFESLGCQKKITDVIGEAKKELMNAKFQEMRDIETIGFVENSNLSQDFIQSFIR